MNWPAFRTRRLTRKEISVPLHFAAVLGSLICVTLLGFFLTTTSSWVAPIGSGARFSLGMLAAGIFLSFGPWVGWAGYLLGIPLTIWALGKGFGGWACVTSIGVVIGLVFSVVLDLGVAAPALGGLLAGFYWIGLRFLSQRRLWA